MKTTKEERSSLKCLLPQILPQSDTANHCHRVMVAVLDDLEEVEKDAKRLKSENDLAACLIKTFYSGCENEEQERQLIRCLNDWATGNATADDLLAMKRKTFDWMRQSLKELRNAQD